MATIRAYASPATFWDAGEHRMVSVPAFQPPVYTSVCECKSTKDVLAFFDAAIEAANRTGKSYSMALRVVAGRKPSGFDKLHLRRDHEVSA